MTLLPHKISIAIGFAVACLQGIYGAERNADLRHWNMEATRATNVCRTINTPTSAESSNEERKKTSLRFSSSLSSISLIALDNIQPSNIPSSFELYDLNQVSDDFSNYLTENNQHIFNQALLCCANAIRAP